LKSKLYNLLNLAFINQFPSIFTLQGLFPLKPSVPCADSMPYLPRGGGSHVPCSAPQVLWELLRCSWKDDVIQPKVDEHVVVLQEFVQYLRK
jgi:hypothetical protein